MEDKTELAGEVVRVVKGGLLVDVCGIRGFVPASLNEAGICWRTGKIPGNNLSSAGN